MPMPKSLPSLRERPMRSLSFLFMCGKLRAGTFGPPFSYFILRPKSTPSRKSETPPPRQEGMREPFEPFPIGRWPAPHPDRFSPPFEPFGDGGWGDKKCGQPAASLAANDFISTSYVTTIVAKAQARRKSVALDRGRLFGFALLPYFADRFI